MIGHVKEGNIRRNNLDPSNVLSAFLIGSSVDTVVGVVDTIMVDVGDVSVVGVVGVIGLVTGLHVTLPKIDKGVDEEKRRDGSKNELGD